MKSLLCAALAALALAGPALAAEELSTAGAHSGPRIIYGQHGDTSFEFDSLRPLRRSNASSRQAYFGSGRVYDETLEELQNGFRTIEERYRFEQLPLTPAQDDAKNTMPPALMRALTLAKNRRAASQVN